MILLKTQKLLQSFWVLGMALMIFSCGQNQPQNTIDEEQAETEVENKKDNDKIETEVENKEETAKNETEGTDMSDIVTPDDSETLIITEDKDYKVLVNDESLSKISEKVKEVRDNIIE